MAITVATALKRDHLLQTAMRAFRNRILPVMAFATKFENVPLEGTNKVQVPYIPLATSATQDFSAGTGYNTATANAVNAKELEINKRKYRMIELTSDEWNRQPMLKLEEIMTVEAEKLADDVLADIWTLVTAANFAGTTLAAMAASAFDYDEVTTLRRYANEANWPTGMRSLTLDSTFAEYLLRDSRLGNQNYGSPDQVRIGTVPVVGGFKLWEVANLPANGAENIAGAAIYGGSAILTGFAPIRPHPTLQKTLVDYQVVVDPETGLALEYRAFGNATLDKVFEVIEVNYGYAVGESAALKRVTKT